MASSIPPLPAVAAESASQNRNRVQAFTQNLANLSAGVRASGDSIRPVEAPPRVEPVPLAAEIRAASDAITQARTADRNLNQLTDVLSRARGLAFQAVNDRSRSPRPDQQEEFRQLIEESRDLTADPDFLRDVSLATFPASIGAIQVIDRTLSEISDQRGLLGLFQTQKLAQVGNMLRTGISGVVSSNAVIRDRVVATNLATSAVADLTSAQNSSLLSGNTAAGQILASLVGQL